MHKLGGQLPPFISKGELIMKNIKTMKVYFASPWFTPEQEEREDRVKNKLRSLGFNVWSPKDNCACSPIADEETRKRIFNANVKNIIPNKVFRHSLLLKTLYAIINNGTLKNKFTSHKGILNT